MTANRPHTSRAKTRAGRLAGAHAEEVQAGTMETVSDAGAGVCIRIGGGSNRRDAAVVACTGLSLQVGPAVNRGRATVPPGIVDWGGNRIISVEVWNCPQTGPEERLGCGFKAFYLKQLRLRWRGICVDRRGRS